MTRGSALLPAALAAASVAVGAVPRILLAAGALPGPLRPFVWSDVLLTYQERLRGGAFPYFDAFFEYPPLIGYASGILARLMPGAVAYVAAWAVVCAVAAAIVAFLLARLADRRSALLWALSPQLFLYGSMNFDVLAVAWLVAALVLARGERPLAALAALAGGAVTKAFPAFVAPVELVRVWDRRGPAWTALGIVVFTAVATFLALPALIAPHSLAESATYVGALTNFDSAWGLISLAARGLALPFASEAIVVVSAVGLAVTYVWTLRRGADLATGAALALLAVLLWTRLYSPQYSLWLVPFFALGALPSRAFALLCAADVLVFATVYPLTLIDWPRGDQLAGALFGVLAAGVVARHTALLVAFVTASRAKKASGVTALHSSPPRVNARA